MAGHAYGVVLFLLRQKKYPKKCGLRETQFLLRISSFHFSFMQTYKHLLPAAAGEGCCPRLKLHFNLLAGADVVSLDLPIVQCTRLPDWDTGWDNLSSGGRAGSRGWPVCAECCMKEGFLGKRSFPESHFVGTFLANQKSTAAGRA